MYIYIHIYLYICILSRWLLLCAFEMAPFASFWLIAIGILWCTLASTGLPWILLQCTWAPAIPCGYLQVALRLPLAVLWVPFAVLGRLLDLDRIGAKMCKTDWKTHIVSCASWWVSWNAALSPASPQAGCQDDMSCTNTKTVPAASRTAQLKDQPTWRRTIMLQLYSFGLWILAAPVCPTRIPHIWSGVRNKLCASLVRTN